MAKIMPINLQLVGGKKAKKGPFNGASMLVFGKGGSLEKMNYGLKHNKCLKIGYERVTKIVGSFVNDLLEVSKKVIHLFTKSNHSTFLVGANWDIF